MKEKLRVGLLSESENIPLWAYRLVENIMQSDFAEIKVVVYPEEENPPADSIGSRGLLARRDVASRHREAW